MHIGNRQCLVCQESNSVDGFGVLVLVVSAHENSWMQRCFCLLTIAFDSLTLTKGLELQSKEDDHLTQGVASVCY